MYTVYLPTYLLFIYLDGFRPREKSIFEPISPALFLLFLSPFYSLFRSMPTSDLKLEITDANSYELNLPKHGR
jgi:hypothetical protein